jgi:hypothetical protein
VKKTENSGAGRSISPVIPQGVEVAEFEQYLEAVKFVDRIVSGSFPASFIAIVGSDLKTVERLRGRVSYARVALSGLVTGSWIGLIFGLLFTGTSDTTAAVNYSSLASSVILGAGLMMLVNVVRFSLNPNKRQFLSSSMVIAGKYVVVVPHDLADQARKAAEANPVK